MRPPAAGVSLPDSRSAGRGRIPAVPFRIFHLISVSHTKTGTDFFITAPIFDLDAIEPFLKAVDFKAAKVIPTVMLLEAS